MFSFNILLDAFFSSLAAIKAFCFSFSFRRDVMGQHESESNLESRREVVSTDALEDDIASEVDYTDDRGQETGNELMELEDSGDDTNSAAPQNVMHRRNLRLVIDEDEDE